MDPKTPVNCTCFNLRKAARAVTQMYDEALKPSGLRATQLSLLLAVAEKGPTGMTELAKQLVMDRTTLTRNLKPLLDSGLAEVVEGADRRHKPIAITARGRQALAESMPLWREVQGRMTEGLGSARWSQLIRDLGAAVDLAQGG
jgi:DNA-binding MarR family transcriptional regulator